MWSRKDVKGVCPSSGVFHLFASLLRIARIGLPSEIDSGLVYALT